MTVNKIPVPFDKAPSISAVAASKPTVIAPNTVKAGIYLFNNCSITLGSHLNPGICKPEAIMCFACDSAPIPAL